ncbi:MAG: VPLPA-CTERM sorting domain-containing protein [Chromatiales bacterium]|nr:VPLPA-CTERM sorting domain-containing protein [Chromatiales bacterium]
MPTTSLPASRARLAAALALSAAALLAMAPASADSVLCGDLAGFGGSTPLTPGGSLREGRSCFSQVFPTNGGVILVEADSDPSGILRATSLVQLPVGVNHLGQSSASWEEAFWVIDHPDPAKQGSLGSARFEFFLEGFLDATGAGRSSVSLVVEGNQTSQRSLFNSAATGASGPRAVNAFIEGTVFFRFGETSNFTLRLVTRAERASGQAGLGSAEAVFSNTGYWGGFTAIEDFDGPVEGFTFGGSNATFGTRGFTSQIPVPVPASAWLLASGLAGLGWLRRRRI